jgi:hypothetical protein
MPLVQNDHMIEDLTTDAPDEALHIRILPWGLGRSHDLFDAHVPDPLPKDCPVDLVATAQQIPWDLVSGKRFDYLLHRPLGCGMLRDMEGHDSSALVHEHYKHKKYLVGHRGDRKEIEGNHSGHVIREERLPRWRGGFVGRTRYFSTVDFATWMPSFRSSPIMRGEP